MANSTAPKSNELNWVWCKGNEHGLTGSFESAVAFALQTQESFMTDWYQKDRVQFDIMCERKAKEVKTTDIVYWELGSETMPFVLDAKEKNSNGTINILYIKEEGKYYPLVDRTWLLHTSGTYVTEYDLVVKNKSSTDRMVDTIRKEDPDGLFTWHTRLSFKGAALDDNPSR